MPRTGSHRAERVAAQLQQELADILRREVKDPRAQNLLVTSVQVGRDLRHARVFLRFAGPEAERGDALAAVRRAGGFVRRALGARMSLRHVPELEFREDEALERGLRVNELLRSLEPEESGGGPDAQDR